MSRLVAVIGLGRFGSRLAREIVKGGGSVLGFDIDKGVTAGLGRIEGIDTHPLRRGQVEHQLREFDPESWDVAVVAIGENFESQQHCIAALQRLGVKEIIARGQSESHKLILRKIGGGGLSRIISPEEEFAEGLAREILRPDWRKVIELAPDVVLIEAAVPESMFGRSLKDLGVGAEYGVLVVGVTRGGALLQRDADEAQSGDPDEQKNEGEQEDSGVIMPARAETQLEQDDTFTLVGKRNRIEDFLDLRPMD